MAYTPTDSDHGGVVVRHAILMLFDVAFSVLIRHTSFVRAFDMMGGGSLPFITNSALGILDLVLHWYIVLFIPLLIADGAVCYLLTRNYGSQAFAQWWDAGITAVLLLYPLYVMAGLGYFVLLLIEMLP